MYDVSANFTYLTSSLMLDASVCHAMLFCVLYYVWTNVTLAEQLESNSPKGLHCLWSPMGRDCNRADTRAGQQVRCWNNPSLSHFLLTALFLFFSFFFLSTSIFSPVLLQTGCVVFRWSYLRPTLKLIPKKGTVCLLFICGLVSVQKLKKKKNSF